MRGLQNSEPSLPDYSEGEHGNNPFLIAPYGEVDISIVVGFSIVAIHVPIE